MSIWLFVLVVFISLGIGFWLGQKSIVWYLSDKYKESNKCPVCNRDVEK